MIQQLINGVFIAGWYISAALFAIQAYKIYKSKDGKGVSLIASAGFCILNLNSTFWMYNHQEYLCMLATIGIAGASFITFVLTLKYGNTTRKYDAVIFDLDGTLFDTQTPVHATAECLALEKHNITIKPEEISKRFAGIPTEKVFQELAAHVDPQELLDSKWSLVREILNSNHPEPLDGITRLLAYLTLAKTPIIIASASPQWYIEILLNKNIDKTLLAGGLPFRHTLLKRYFGTNFVSADEVTLPKPAPDVFLEAAKRLKVDPKRCLVIGDGKSDVRGGTAAGMDVLFLGDSDQEIESLPNVLSFSKSSDLVSYVLKQKDFF